MKKKHQSFIISVSLYLSSSYLIRFQNSYQVFQFIIFLNLFNKLRFAYWFFEDSGYNTVIFYTLIYCIKVKKYEKSKFLYVNAVL